MAKTVRVLRLLAYPIAGTVFLVAIGLGQLFGRLCDLYDWLADT